jgi:hypothetical protein
MNFLKISKEILETSKKYGDVNPEIQRIFETSFVTFMDIVKSLDKHIPVNEGKIKTKIFEDLFGPMKKSNNQCGMTPTKESSDIDKDLFKELTNKEANTNGFGGFDPNANPNEPDIELLSDLKNKIKNINKEKLNKNNKKIVEDFKKE